MKAQILAATVALIAAAPLVPALADDAWNIDSKHAVAEFSVKHMMVSNVRGTLTGIKGTANWDGKNIKKLKVDAEIDVRTINTNEQQRDEHLRSAEFFDANKYPVISFRSKKSVAVKGGKFKLIGDLTMHGVTREVQLDVDGPTPAVKDPWGNERVGATATTKVNRKDFGIEYNKLLEAGGAVIGDEVSITLDIELLRSRPSSPSTGSKSG